MISSTQFDYTDNTNEEEQKMLNKVLQNSIKITSIEDEEILKAIEESMEIERKEKEEWEKIIKASIETAEDEREKLEDKKRKRPSRNVNKIIMFDLTELNQTKEIEIIIAQTKHTFQINATLVEDNIQHWNVIFETGNSLWKTMTWDVKFTDQFPAKPPKIRVLQPYFKPYTGHITIGGAICNPLLVTGQGWNPETEMLPLFIALINGMIDSDSPAKLNDNDERTQVYNDANAEAARVRYLKNHGWKY